MTKSNERDVGDDAVAIMAARRGKSLPGVGAPVHMGDVGDAAAAIMAARRGKTLATGDRQLVWIDAPNGKRLLVSPELKRAMENGPLPGESQVMFAERITAYLPKRTNVRAEERHA